MTTKILLIGQAEIDITPSSYKIAMIGHNPIRFEGLNDRLYAQATVFSQERTTVCVISADLVGYSLEFTRDVQERIARRLGIPRENIVLCATHTHRGPDMYWPHPRKNNIAYIETLKKKFVKIAENANANLAPAAVGAGAGRASIGINRRLPVDGQVAFLPNPKGAYDRELWVVKIIRGNQLTGLLLSHGCHPSGQKPLLISADYPGHVRALLKKKYGPHVRFSYLLGCCGDVRPNGPLRGQKWTLPTKKQVREMAASVIQTVKKIKEEKNAQLKFLHSSLQLPFDRNRIPLSELEKRHGELVTQIKNEKITDKDPAKHYILRYAQAYANAIRLKKGRQNPKPAVFDLALLRIGRIIFVFLPGEVFTEIGMQIKKLQRNQAIIPVTMYNELCTYICTARACREGGYESNVDFVWYAGKFPFPFSPACEKIIVNKVNVLLKRINQHGAV